MQTIRFVFALPLLAAFALTGCEPPPPAPEGLDASTSYMMREFYKDDAVFQAGIQGFMNWYFEEGYRLTGVGAGDGEDQEPLDSFTIGTLTEEDIGHFPLADDGRDLARASGVVSLAEMECDWQTAEDYLVRPDQSVVFDGTWEGYDRTYRTSREEFQSASMSGDFAPITEELDPFAEDFDPAPYASSLIMLENVADPAPVLVDLPAYDLYWDGRHAVVDLEDPDNGTSRVGALAILTYSREAVYDASGDNGLLQSYSVEINVERPGDRTLRMLAVWAEPVGGGLDPDSAFVLNYAVNTSLSASNRLSDICSGAVEIPAE